MKKLISLLFAALLCLSSLCACSGDAEDTTDGVTKEAEYVFTDTSSIPSPLSINGEKVPYDIFRYYYHAVKYRYDQGEESYWSSHEYNDAILKETLVYIRDNYALEEYAAQLGVELTAYELNEIESDIESTRYTYSSDYDYNKTLDENYLTEEVYRYTLKISDLYDKVFDYLTGEDSNYKISSSETLVRRFLDNYISRADHIFILNDVGDDVNENETLINRIYEQLLQGADFQELKKKYSEDDNTNTSDTGYYFTEGDIGEEFEQAALALQVGELSGVIKAPYGYHIIIRLAFDEKYINDNMEDVFVPLYQKHMMRFAIRKLVDKQEIVFDDTYAQYTVNNVK